MFYSKCFKLIENFYIFVNMKIKYLTKAGVIFCCILLHFIDIAFFLWKA